MVEILPKLRQALGQHQTQAALPRRLTLQSGQRGTGWQQGNPLTAGWQQQLSGQPLRYAALMQEQVETAALQRVRVMTEIAGHRPMGIEIDHDHPFASIGQQAG
ncbi:hypothetical protein FQZ97_960560 [compost metagenome]